MKLKTKVMMMTLACSMVVAAAPAMADEVKSGLVVEDGVNYIYKNNKKVTNKLGYKLSKKYYKISKTGEAKEVTEVEGLAGIRLESFKKQNLKNAFNWCYKKIKFNANVGKPKKGQKEYDYYALRGFKTKKGDCKVMAACFYQMAKVLGNNATYIKGKIRTATGKDTHAWVTIKHGKKTYVYDPNFAFVFHKRTKNSAAASGFKMTYTKKAGGKGQYTYYTSKGKQLK